MRKVKSLFVILFVLIFVPDVFGQLENGVSSDTIINNMTWYRNKQEAVDSAKAQGKYILMLSGRSKCGFCQGDEKRIYEVNNIHEGYVNKHFILWFHHYDECPKKSFCDENLVAQPSCEDVAGYFEPVCNDASFTELPLICIINPSDTVNISYGLVHGAQPIYKLYNMMCDFVDAHTLPDANETLLPTVEVFVSGGKLYVSGGSADETVCLYSVTGQLVARFDKKDIYATCDIPNQSKGILIVTGSSGWSEKVAVR